MSQSHCMIIKLTLINNHITWLFASMSRFDEGNILFKQVVIIRPGHCQLYIYIYIFFFCFFVFFANANLAFLDDFLYVSNTYLHVTTSVPKEFSFKITRLDISKLLLKKHFYRRKRKERQKVVASGWILRFWLPY